MKRQLLFLNLAEEEDYSESDASYNEDEEVESDLDDNNPTQDGTT